MSKNYRFRTKVGQDREVRLQIQQDFDMIEILSLKLKQEDVYTRFCADYGVVAGRVIANGGYGVPNVSVSIFVPLSSQDENDPIISTLYPYKRVDQKNEDGYRYNLLPYKKEYGGHTPTGTFPDIQDILERKEVLEIYEKYYKYTVRTNDSGDFMIVGVPLGMQTIVMDMDLSNIGCFSLRPSDLIRMGMGVESQFNGSQFKSSTDIESLPQIINSKKDIEVTSFWGEDEICNVGITRVDFDIRDLGIKIEPQAIFMGSMISTTEEGSLGANCKPKFDSGNLCDLISSPGKILAIRQTIYSDTLGYPILEEYKLPEGGNVINDEGTWLVEIPMNLDYVTTNEFGEQVLSNDPNNGIPTKAKYRFKIQYQNEDPNESNILRADYLVPNIKEYGWNTSSQSENSPQYPDLQKKSYAFSLDWDDYGDTGTTLGNQIIQEAVDCKDKFFEFNFNRVYTISSFIDRWKWGFNRARHMGIKEITDRTCNTTTNKMPVNDGVRNFDFIFFLFNLLITILSPIFLVIIIIYHFVAKIYPIIRRIVNVIIRAINSIITGICNFLNWVRDFFGRDPKPCNTETINELEEKTFPRISLPMMAYPDCEACNCETVQAGNGEDSYPSNDYTNERVNQSQLIDVNSVGEWNWEETYEYNKYQSYCTTFPEGCDVTENTLNYGVNQGIAGYSGPTPKIQKTPISTWVSQDSRVGSQAYTIHWAQTLNMMNSRARYFENQSVITTTIKNKDFQNVEQVSTPFKDQPLILICDPGTIASIGGSGSLITFNNLFNINDPNLTGSTQNQFNSKSVTGTSDYNLTQLVNKQITYVNPVYNSESISQSTVKLKLTKPTQDYKFRGGVEYFQVITGGTLDTFNQYLQQPIYTSFIGQYVYNAGMKLRWGKGYGSGTTSNTFTYYPIQPPLDFWKNVGRGYPITPNTFFDSFGDKEIIFLTRGVDPYTEKQTIEYDLSRMFNQPAGTLTIKGQYYLNIPIQSNNAVTTSSSTWAIPGVTVATWRNNHITPESLDVVNNKNNKIYHKPFNNFNIQSTWTAFTNNSVKYYTSTDKSRATHRAYNNDQYTIDDFSTNGVYCPVSLTYTNGYSTLGQGWTDVDPTDIYNPTNYRNIITFDQGIIEGSSFIGSNIKPGEIIDIENPINFIRVYAPSYYLDNPTYDVTLTEKDMLVLRTDRLPTSTSTEISGNTSLPLFLNDNFFIYRVSDSGDLFAVNLSINQQTDTTNNMQDFTGDTQSAVSDAILNSLTCEGLTSLECYSGYGSNFGVITPCAANNDGDLTKQRIIGGCYYFVQEPYLNINSIREDIKFFAEWKARFRLTFAACRGVISHVFQNNWVNGTLYSFAFRKKTIFDNQGGVKRNVFCGSNEALFNPVRPNQGPIYFDEVNNSFLYRSTPYSYETSKFVGQKPKYKTLLGFGNFIDANFKGMNDRNIFFPTTIMDLGPRDEFSKEICFNPQLDGYLVDTMKTTSYNDTSDILLFFILSRLLASNLAERLSGLGDASVNALFSRSEDRLDGDVVQMFSINSEYGIVPFNDDNYNDDDVFLLSTTTSNGDDGPVIGLYFSSDTQSRIQLTPGITTYGTVLQQNGYPSTQEVPMYKWESDSTQPQNLFGSELNEWFTDLDNGGFYSIPYQSMQFDTTDYFHPQNGTGPFNGATGYIYNYDSNGNPNQNTNQWSQGQSKKFVVGAPYHFYFGLRKGKSAINRYITKYILGQ